MNGDATTVDENTLARLNGLETSPVPDPEAKNLRENAPQVWCIYGVGDRPSATARNRLDKEIGRANEEVERDIPIIRRGLANQPAPLHDGFFLSPEIQSADGSTTSPLRRFVSAFIDVTHENEFVSLRRALITDINREI